MPRNTRASKRKNEDSDLAQTPTPSKKKAQTPSTTPQSTKTRKTNKTSPKTESTTPSNKRTKRKLDEESAGEESSPSASPKNKKRDTRNTKPKVKSPAAVEPIEEENASTKKQTKTAPTPPRTSTRRSKRNSSACINDSVTENKLSDEEKASPTPKKPKTLNTVTPQKTSQKKETQKKELETVQKVVKKAAKIIEKVPLPRKLSREEIYQNYLKTLELKLNRFDLSNKEDGSGDLFSKWPDSEVMNNIKKNPLLNRIWYSNEATNGASEKAVGEFNVASYDIKEIKSGSDNFTQVFSLIKEEIGYIDADVFCIQNVSSDCEKNLLSCLGERKYTYSGPNHGCVIGFRDKKFTIIDSKVITPNQTLIEFIDKTSYPTAWKDSLKASIDHPNSLNSCPLIIHVLKHIESGVLVLLASQSQLNRQEMKPEDSLLSRPDLNALNVTSIMWSICRAWNEIVEKKKNDSSNRNAIKNTSNGNHNKTTKGCWLFCGSLNASHESPIYQLIRDGYPCDDTINRLRCIRSVNLELGPKEMKEPEGDRASDENSMKKSLIDLIWHAFQHPQTDVASCYADVIGREPPFTQISSDSKNNVSSSKCDHYIWCSKSSLRPKAVLLTPCRALMSGVKEPNINSYSIPLAAKIEIISNC